MKNARSQTQIMGIVNLTPDSFSGDGLHGTAEIAIRSIDGKIKDGASVIDIGAESTRPGAVVISAEEEWQRLAPLMALLGDRIKGVRFSIDTRHAETARKVLEHGVHIINDVSGACEPALIKLIKKHDASLVLMHSLTIPADPKQTIASDADPVEVVLAWAKAKLMALEGQGLSRTQIIIDPGIGFGKISEQSWNIIRNIARLKTLGVPILIGHSRKSFLSLFCEKHSAERDPETLAVSYYLASEGVDYLRVHDVKSHAAMLRIRAAL